MGGEFTQANQNGIDTTTALTTTAIKPRSQLRVESQKKPRSQKKFYFPSGFGL